eukprot:g28447.t1
MIFVALITPIQVGLLQLRLDALFVVSIFIDLIFFVDMILQFITAYSRRTVRGVEWEVRLNRIVPQYLTLGPSLEGLWKPDRRMDWGGDR